MPNTLTIQHLIDAIPDEGWLSSDSREKFVDAASELVDEGWPTERISTFLSNLFSAVCEEVS